MNIRNDVVTGFIAGFIVAIIIAIVMHNKYCMKPNLKKDTQISLQVQNSKLALELNQYKARYDKK